MDELEGRPDVPGRSVGRRAGSMALLAGLLLGALCVSACGQAATTPVASGDPATSATGPAADTSQTKARTTPPGVLTAGATCPVTAAAVSTITGVRVYPQSAGLAGSCAFDSTPRGAGLAPSEVRVNILTGPDDLASLYTFFSQQLTKGLPSCRPFRLLRRPDLGAGGFETLCGATATSGPASADDYLPLQGGKQLTVTVNRGVAVRDHRLLTCEAQAVALVSAVRTAW